MQVGSVIRRRVTNRGGTREERGRLKTQDYTRLRDSINGMYKASRAREAQLIDLFLADTLDVDDFLWLKNRNANAPKVAYQVCIDHERTWDKRASFSIHQFFFYLPISAPFFCLVFCRARDLR